MPIYEYTCQSCHRTLEFIQKFSDPLQTTCPHCQGTLEKMVSSTSFQLKGTGWYVTDFKPGDKKSEQVDSSAVAEQTTPETPPASTQKDGKTTNKDSNKTTTTSSTTTAE